MHRIEKKIIGIGCDFQSENEMNSTRKLAIENLSGGEKEKIRKRALESERKHLRRMNSAHSTN